MAAAGGSVALAAMGRMPTRLLVLEDDDGIRTALRLAMEDEGYEVCEARERARGAASSSSATRRT